MKVMSVLHNLHWHRFTSKCFAVIKCSFNLLIILIVYAVSN